MDIVDVRIAEVLNMLLSSLVKRVQDLVLGQGRDSVCRRIPGDCYLRRDVVDGWHVDDGFSLLECG